MKTLKLAAFSIAMCGLLFTGCEPSAMFEGVYPNGAYTMSCTSTTATTGTTTVKISGFDSDAAKVSITEEGGNIPTLTGVVEGEKLTLDPYSTIDGAGAVTYTGTGTVSSNTITLNLTATYTALSVTCTYTFTGSN